MIIKNYNYPFYHTIIYDYFNDEEYNLIYSECEYISNTYPLQDFVDDGHHKMLSEEYLTKPYFLDSIFYNKREESNILRLGRKIFDIDIIENPYFGFIKHSTQDLISLTKYENNSGYFQHRDCCTMVILYTIWNEPKQWSGGNLIFSNYNYKPELKSNCCVIFPGFETHEVEKLSGEGIRYTINQRVFIK
jgi:hypothetical protein